MKILAVPTALALVLAFAGPAFAGCGHDAAKTTTAETEKPKPEAPTG